MEADFSHLLTPLRKGTVRHRCGGKGRGIAVFQGQVWLTQSGDPRDLILTAGESFDFDRPGIVVVQAFTDASVVWFDGTGHEPDRASRDEPLRRVDGSRISAFALHRAARDMRNAAIARALLRAAGAASFAWNKAVLALRRLQHRLAVADDCRGLQRS